MLQAHTITSAPGARRGPKKIGRGNASGHGTSSTRGGKGQTARSGGTRGLLKKSFKFLLQSTPKLRGFTSLRKKSAEVYLGDLEKHFQDGETVDVAALKEKNLIHENDKKAKVLNTGTISKKLVISGLMVTKAVAEKIKAVGGEVR